LRLSNPNKNTMKKFMPRARANAASGGPMSETTMLLEAVSKGLSD